ncbi:hypothetical protein BDA96_10G025800 [Sorghum bicolor]|uniref:Uncharacterized protein n=1 Tax=Sorghum bicolor TaxID=4558 RepID=A0A921Q2K6_SORBI|nr:hypothetical protein BDA96_10G025800 [Sorghum bicolor]
MPLACPSVLAVKFDHFMKPCSGSCPLHGKKGKVTVWVSIAGLGKQQSRAELGISQNGQVEQQGNDTVIIVAMEDGTVVRGHWIDPSLTWEPIVHC